MRFVWKLPKYDAYAATQTGFFFFGKFINASSMPENLKTLVKKKHWVLNQNEIKKRSNVTALVTKETLKLT